jgi:hypothetical protein
MNRSFCPVSSLADKYHVPYFFLTSFSGTGGSGNSRRLTVHGVVRRRLVPYAKKHSTMAIMLETVRGRSVRPERFVSPVT